MREEKLQAVKRLLAARIEATQRALAITAERSLSAFVRQAWPTIEPTTPLVWGWHLDAICSYLEAVTRGEIRRLIINIPPRMTKSLIISVFWPAWEWIHDPGLRAAFVSYSSDASTPLSLKRRNVISSAWYQGRWGGRVELARDANLKTEFSNTTRGELISTSVGGTLMSRGGRRVVIDDPHNPKEALSDVQREAAIEFYRSTVTTRLDDAKTGAIVLIQQRLHEDDLTGYLLREEPGRWTHLSLPMEAEGDEVVTYPSGEVHCRSDGELLQPERFGPEEIAFLKLGLGSYGVAAQLQQRPAPLGGGIFRRDWWKYFTVPPEFKRVVQFWDTAFKSGTENDYSVCTTWGETATGFYLLEVWRERIEFPELKRVAIALADRWKPHAVLVEDKASGQSLVQELQRETSLPVVPWKVDKDKVARATAVTPLVEAGRVFLREDAPWLLAYINELSSFPTAPHDDQVDSTTGALAYLTQGGNGWSLYFAEEMAASATKRQEMSNAA